MLKTCPKVRWPKKKRCNITNILKKLRREKRNLGFGKWRIRIPIGSIFVISLWILFSKSSDTLIKFAKIIVPILLSTAALTNSDRSSEFCREAIRTIYRVINSESTWSSKAKTPKMRRETRSSIWVSYFCCQNDATLAEVAVR